MRVANSLTIFNFFIFIFYFPRLGEVLIYKFFIYIILIIHFNLEKDKMDMIRFNLEKDKMDMIRFNLEKDETK